MVAKKISKHNADRQTVRLPIFVPLPDEDVDGVVSAVRKILRGTHL